MMIFVPLSRAEARSLRDGDIGCSSDWVGQMGTPALMAAHDLEADMTEDADYTALRYAGIRALMATHDALRLVAAIDVPAADLSIKSSDPYGEARASRIRWSLVTALFADEPATAPVVAEARATLTSGASIADALDNPAVLTLADEYDLLWFAPAELDSLED
ncbi:MAG TPA: hypothetical protein VFJ97_10800 [Dermatophilaceae bacterium]|nr:hypothetical protein [Dermatophilaceae bacterium]